MVYHAVSVFQTVTTGYPTQPVTTYYPTQPVTTYYPTQPNTQPRANPGVGMAGGNTEVPRPVDNIHTDRRPVDNVHSGRTTTGQIPVSEDHAATEQPIPDTTAAQPEVPRRRFRRPVSRDGSHPVSRDGSRPVSHGSSRTSRGSNRTSGIVPTTIQLIRAGLIPVIEIESDDD